MFNIKLPFRGLPRGPVHSLAQAMADRVAANLKATEIASEIVDEFGPSEKAMQNQCVVRAIEEADPHITWASIWIIANYINKRREQ